jgi:hypothetical protein
MSQTVEKNRYTLTEVAPVHREFLKALTLRDKTLSQIEEALNQELSDEYTLRLCMDFQRRQLAVRTWYTAIEAMTGDIDQAWAWEHDHNQDSSFERIQDIYANRNGYDLMLRAKQVHRGIDTIPTV